LRLVFFGTSGPVAGAGDSNVSFLVDLADKSVLVDCSGNPASSLSSAGCDVCDLDILVLTHAHTDHLYGLPSLIHAAWLSGRRKPLRIISNDSTRQRAEQLLEVFELHSKADMFEYRWGTQAEGTIDVSEGDTADDATIAWFPVRHGVATIGLAFRDPQHSVVYSGDTAPLLGVQEQAAGCSLLIHECSGPAADQDELSAKGHTSAAQAGALAQAAPAESLALVHVPPLGRAALLREASACFSGPVIIPTVGQWIVPGAFP